MNCGRSKLEPFHTRQRNVHEAPQRLCWTIQQYACLKKHTDSLHSTLRVQTNERAGSRALAQAAVGPTDRLRGRGDNRNRRLLDAPLQRMDGSAELAGMYLLDMAGRTAGQAGGMICTCRPLFDLCAIPS